VLCRPGSGIEQLFKQGKQQFLQQQGQLFFFEQSQFFLVKQQGKLFFFEQQSQFIFLQQLVFNSHDSLQDRRRV